LQAARDMTELVCLGDATFATLSASLDTESLVDLLIAIGEYNGMVRVMAAIQIDLEPEYAGYLERFPLPASSD
jgi:alkylhydroperoxidase family enzyme